MQLRGIVTAKWNMVFKKVSKTENVVKIGKGLWLIEETALVQSVCFFC